MSFNGCNEWTLFNHEYCCFCCCCGIKTHWNTTADNNTAKRSPAQTPSPDGFDRNRQESRKQNCASVLLKDIACSSQVVVFYWNFQSWNIWISRNAGIASTQHADTQPNTHTHLHRMSPNINISKNQKMVNLATTKPKFTKQNHCTSWVLHMANGLPSMGCLEYISILSGRCRLLLPRLLHLNTKIM